MDEIQYARNRRNERTQAAFETLKDHPAAEHEQIVNAIIVDHMDLADALARRYRRGGEDYGDLRQVALLGLVKAARRFDPEVGTPFVPYAIPTIMGELKRHLRDHGWLVRPGRQLQELCGALTSARPRLAQRIGREPTDAELAEEIGVTVEGIRQARDCLDAQSPVTVDARDDDESPVAVLPTGDEQFVRAELRATVAAALGHLEPREALIVVRRFVEERTQAEIGAELGISQMQVSRLLSRILAQLRTELEPVLPHGLADAA